MLNDSSSLRHDREELGHEFDQFLETAREASYDLQTFNSHVGRAVDSVIAITHWTTRVLEGISESESSRGLVAGWINSLIPSGLQPSRLTENVVLDQYIQHTRLVEDEIHRLIAEAQALLMILTNLDDRLETIGGIAHRDDSHARAAKEDVLSLLWTRVGGNKGKIANMNRQLILLKNVGTYRASALAHVQGTVLRLQAIESGLEDLRERVGAPELMKDRVAIPLSVHLESIARGVERLEEKRSSARKQENEVIRRTLERPADGGVMIEAS